MKKKGFFELTAIDNVGIKFVLIGKYPKTLDLAVRISLLCDER